MNNVNRNIKARLGPPRESSISVRSRVDEKVTSQYSKTEAQQFVRYSLASRFFSFKCGICGETYSFEGKGGFLVTNETTEMQNYNSSQTLVSSGFISCFDCFDIYQKHHAITGIAIPLLNIFK